MSEQPKNPWAHVDKDLLVIADFLQGSKAKLKIAEGVLQGSRYSYFKGKAGVNALMRDPYAQTLKRPALAERADGEAIMQKILKSGLVISVEVSGSGQKKQLQINQGATVFSPDRYYIWVYQGNQMFNQIAGIGIVALIFIGVLFPLWPLWMRTGVYYLSLGMMGLMGLFFVLAIVRLILWVFLLLFYGRGGWLYPNLFADCGVIESFYPLWA